eukprot:COSAG06_NODE_5174_length_3662_cov_2.173730_5_plen_221_part_00
MSTNRPISSYVCMRARENDALSFRQLSLLSTMKMVGLSVVCPEPVLVNGFAFRKEVDHSYMGYAYRRKQEGVVSPYLCRELSVVVLVEFLQQIFPVPVRHLLARPPHHLDGVKTCTVSIKSAPIILPRQAHIRPTSLPRQAHQTIIRYVYTCKPLQVPMWSESIGKRKSVPRPAPARPRCFAPSLNAAAAAFPDEKNLINSASSMARSSFRSIFDKTGFF